MSDENDGEESQAPVSTNEGSDQEKETEVRKNHDIVVVFSDSDHDD